MKQLIINLLLMFGNVLTLVAQVEMPSNIYVESTPTIDSLIQKRIKLYLIAGVANGNNAYKTAPLAGYRIQIFYGNNRKEIFEKQAHFISLYPDLGTYMEYKEPNYYLKIGDFRTRQEAEAFLPEIRKYYKTTFIKYDKINPAKLKPLENGAEKTYQTGN